MRLGHSEISATSEALRELYAHTDALTLPHCMVRLVRRLVSADSAAYNHIDYRNHQLEVVHDHGPEADRFIPALNAHISEHPVLQYWLQQHCGDPAKLSDFLGRRQLRDTAIYQEFFGPLRVQEQIGFFVEEKGRVAITLSLQRSGSNFTERERDLLAFLQPHFIQAYKNAADLSAAKDQASGFQGALRVCDVGVICLGRDEQVEWMSSRAELLLMEHFKGGAPASSPRRPLLPAPLGDWISTQKIARKEQAGPAWKAQRTFSQPVGELTVRWAPETRDRSYLILSERPASASPDELLQLGLSNREAEVLYWLAEGKSNEAIAILLGLSKRTIEKHVERILSKLAVESRTSAALRAAACRQGS